MKNFFGQSFKFWFISKILLMLLLFISAGLQIIEGRLRPEEFAVNFLGIIEAVFLFITLFHDLESKSNYPILKVITGIIMILLGSALLVVLLSVSESLRSKAYIFGFPLGIWMILVGIFDTYRLKSTSS